MKCPFCDREIEEGSLYCNHCGNAIQVVPDYNVLEDDVLPAMVNNVNRNEEEAKTKNSLKQMRKKSRLYVLVFVMVLFALLATISILAIRYYNSDRYFKTKGDEAFYDGEYSVAISYYLRILDENGDDVDVLFALGNAQNAAGYYEDARNTYGHALLLDENNLEVFQALVILLNNNNSSELEALSSVAKTKEQKEFLDLYRITPPTISVKSGTYSDDVTTEILCDEGDSVYYTTDGTQPSAKNGTLYEGEITIDKQGTTILSAVSCDKDTQKLSAVTTETYEIVYEAPQQPLLSPSGGRLTKETYVTITAANEKDRIYYTWDDTIPTVNSARYTEPIPVPEGNNILTVIAINDHDMASDVYKANYIYLP